MRRALVVVADDYGLTPGVCEGILRAHKTGLLTTTSVLANGPVLDRHVASLRDSGLAVGAHLALVGEDPPVLSAREVPTLVTRTGSFPLTWDAFIRRSMLGRVNPQEVRAELGAQLEALRGAGLELTHVDTHQHMHLWPAVGNVVLDVAAHSGIDVVRQPSTRRIGPKSSAVRVLAATAQRRHERRGFRCTGASVGLDEAGSMGANELLAAIARLDRTGALVCDLWMHPGTRSDPARDRYRWGYRWADELEALCSTAVRSAVDRAGFRLTTYPDALAAPH